MTHFKNCSPAVLLPDPQVDAEIARRDLVVSWEEAYADCVEVLDDAQSLGLVNAAEVRNRLEDVELWPESVLPYLERGLEERSRFWLLFS